MLETSTRIDAVAAKVEEILEIFGLELPGTADRVARSLVDELWSGLDPDKAPELVLFEVPEGDQEVEVREIEVHSMCEHHLLSIQGHARVAYRPQGRVLGLSKVHRLVDYLARRPILQERLTSEIADALQRALHIEDVEVEISAKHGCVSCRGVGHAASSMVTRVGRGRYG
jgi:GTP cyclohydrolase IA